MTDLEAALLAAGIRPFGAVTPDGAGGFEVKGADALVIRGLLRELPPVGVAWPLARRDEWLEAVRAAFAVLYERESSEGSSLTPGTGGVGQP